MKLRSIHTAFTEIKEADPSTAVTEYMIRKIVTSGEIPTIQSGNRKLFDLDQLLHYLEVGKA